MSVCVRNVYTHTLSTTGFVEWVPTSECALLFWPQYNFWKWGVNTRVFCFSHPLMMVLIQDRHQIFHDFILVAAFYYSLVRDNAWSGTTWSMSQDELLKFHSSISSKVAIKIIFTNSLLCTFYHWTHEQKTGANSSDFTWVVVPGGHYLDHITTSPPPDDWHYRNTRKPITDDVSPV